MKNAIKALPFWLYLVAAVGSYAEPITIMPTGVTSLDYGFEATISYPSVSEGAAQYWARYPDVKVDPYYGAAPERAYEHYVNHGQHEGRFWFVTTHVVKDAFSKVGGQSAYYFPKGGQIIGIDWQTVAKATDHEVIFIMVMSRTGTNLYEPGSVRLMKRHHIGATATNREAVVALADPIPIPAGWYIWLYCDGWGNGMVESQTTVRVKP
jgi:hypothetical protein